MENKKGHLHYKGLSKRSYLSLNGKTISSQGQFFLLEKDILRFQECSLKVETFDSKKENENHSSKILKDHPKDHPAIVQSHKQHEQNKLLSFFVILIDLLLMWWWIQQGSEQPQLFHFKEYTLPLWIEKNGGDSFWLSSMIYLGIHFCLYRSIIFILRIKSLGFILLKVKTSYFKKIFLTLFLIIIAQVYPHMADLWVGSDVTLRLDKKIVVDSIYPAHPTIKLKSFFVQLQIQNLAQHFFIWPSFEVEARQGYKVIQPRLLFVDKDTGQVFSLGMIRQMDDKQKIFDRHFQERWDTILERLTNQSSQILWRIDPTPYWKWRDKMVALTQTSTQLNLGLIEDEGKKLQFLKASSQDNHQFGQRFSYDYLLVLDQKKGPIFVIQTDISTYQEKERLNKLITLWIQSIQQFLPEEKKMSLDKIPHFDNLLFVFTMLDFFPLVRSPFKNKEQGDQLLEMTIRFYQYQLQSIQTIKNSAVQSALKIPLKESMTKVKDLLMIVPFHRHLEQRRNQLQDMIQQFERSL